MNNYNHLLHKILKVALWYKKNLSEWFLCSQIITWKWPFIRQCLSDEAHPFKRFFWTSLVVISGGLALGTNIGYQYRCQFSASMSVLSTVWFSNICYYQINIAAFMIAILLYKTIHYRARSSWASTTWTLSTLVAFGGRLQTVLQ